MKGLGAIRGLIVLRDDRAEVSAKVHAAAAAALNDGARELLRVANQTVPKEEGILEGSGDVIEATPDHLVATVGYGGEAKAYAVRQHEETNWHHDAGERAKWLEMAAKEDGPRIMDGVGEQMRGEL